jgi:hypothetical protein
MGFRALMLTTALLLAPAAFAGTYTLSDWCFYVNSVDINQSCNSGNGLANVPSADPGVTDLIHLQSDGTGTVTITLSPGSYNVFGILNYNVDGNGANEYANALGQLSMGQVYSVSTQGSTGTVGTLYGQVGGGGGTFNDTNYCAVVGNCSDLAVGLGYTNVTVPDGWTTTVTFTSSTNPPSDPNTFSIQQTNSGTGNSLNLSSSLEQVDHAPEPGPMALMGSGLGAMLWYVRRRRNA